MLDIPEVVRIHENNLKRNGEKAKILMLVIYDGFY